MTLDIALGADVISKDFKRVGKVDGLVVDPDNMNMLEIIVQKGFWFTADRIIDMVYIDRVDDDGTVYLKIDATDSDKMPPLYPNQYVVANTLDRGSMPYAVGGGSSMNQPIMWRASTIGRSMHVSDAAGYMAAVAESAPVEIRSDLPAAAVVLDTGTDVIAVDGKKIGTVEDVIYDERGRLTGFVARTGIFNHHDVLVPISNVAAITHRYVRLNADSITIKGA